MHVKYPWKRWFRKKRFNLTAGKEFKCMPHSMGVAVRTQARLHKVWVSIKVEQGKGKKPTVLHVTVRGPRED